MFNNIPYRSIAYAITKRYLNKDSAEFYLYWEEKLNNVDFPKLSMVDKVFVIMCQWQRIGSTWRELKEEHQINITEDDVYNILLNCQCYDIEITAMAKSFLYYQFSRTRGLEDQIYYITKHGEIELPYEYKIEE